MSFTKSVERVLRNTKRKVGEPKLLQPVIRLLRNKYHSDGFQKSKLKHFVLPELKTVFHKITGEELSDDLLNEALNTYAMKNDFGKYHAGDYDVLLLYCIVRKMKPDVFIETGICSGRSSSAILEALKDNDYGTLYSIDLPRMFEGGGTQLVSPENTNDKYHSTLTEDAEEPGWLVPEHLKSRWNKILGDSNVELPKLVNELDIVNIFYHDSDHTYKTMMNEMSTAWKKIPAGGLLIVDDATCTNAYEDFKQNTSFTVEHMYSGFAVIKR